MEAIPDQAWAETYLVERYAELKAQLAAEADRQNPQPETEISAASSEVADVVPAVPGGAIEGGEAAGVEGSRAALAGEVSGQQTPLRLPPPSRPRVRAARGRGGGPRAVRERRGRDARMNRFVVSDPSRCIGCSACRVTCTESHRRRALRPASRISLVKTRTVSAAVTCHQCEGAPCMTVCPEGAIVQERDRLHVDESRCTGCLLCARVPVRGGVPVGASTAHVKAAPYSRASSARSAGCCARRRRAPTRRW
ncbi:MAG: 4Fe-4S dicluster domain-containing protein [Eggerthellaceae bacterium]